MTAASISVGDRLRLKPNNNYGLDGDYLVTAIQPRPGYRVPWIVCESRRPERGVLYFKPSDFARRA